MIPHPSQSICVFHGLGSYTYEKWYKEVFSPFEAGLHSGEVGGPVAGPAFAKVINLTILRGRNPEAAGGETVAVFMLVPNENGDPAAKGAREDIQKSSSTLARAPTLSGRREGTPDGSAPT